MIDSYFSSIHEEATMASAEELAVFQAFDMALNKEYELRQKVR